MVLVWIFKDGVKTLPVFFLLLKVLSLPGSKIPRNVMFQDLFLLFQDSVSKRSMVFTCEYRNDRSIHRSI